MDLFNYIKNIFPSSCCDEGKNISKESLERSDDYCIQYAKWMKSEKRHEMLQMVYEASLKRTGCPSKKDKSICFLMIPKINGFTMHYDNKRWEVEDFQYLLEYLATLLVKEQGYERTSSSKETTEYPNRIEIVERYQLKTTDTEKDYSDILLRLCYTNNEITSLKFCATCTKHRLTNFPQFLKEIATL